MCTELNLKALDLNKYNSDQFIGNFDKKILTNWINSELKSIHFLFPSAEINFVLPSGYYHDFYNTKYFKKTKEVLFERVNSFHVDTGVSTKFLYQTFFPSSHMLCDSVFHGNKIGRQWRTNNLFNELKFIKFE